MNWYYQEDGIQVGPLTETEFEQKIQVGRVQGQTLVWNDTMSDWQPYASLSSGAQLAVQAACARCGKTFPEAEMVRYGNSFVCADCKPLFFQGIKEGNPPVATGVWRDGSKLVAGIGATLPDRCVKCNAPAEGRVLTRTLYWHPQGWYLLICAGVLFYAIAALIVRKKAVVNIPLCTTHYQKRKTAIGVTWGLVGLSILMIILGIAKYPLLAILGILGFLGAAIYSIAAVQVVSPARIDERFCWLNKVNKDYLAALPAFQP